MYFAAGDDPKRVEAEMREKREKLHVKYRNQFVREVISNKGTDEVIMHECSYHFNLCAHMNLLVCPVWALRS